MPARLSTTADVTAKLDAIHACRELAEAADHAPGPAKAVTAPAEMEGGIAPEDWRQLDQWADEGGAIAPSAFTARGRTSDRVPQTSLASKGSASLATVRALERQRIEATRSNDAAALAGLLDEQLIYINSAGEMYGKQHYLRGIETHALSYDRDFDVREADVREFDDLVIIAGTMLGHSRLNGERQVFHFPCIGVWRKDEGKWRMVAWQSSSGSR